MLMLLLVLGLHFENCILRTAALKLTVDANELPFSFCFLFVYLRMLLPMYHSWLKEIKVPHT